MIEARVNPNPIPRLVRVSERESVSKENTEKVEGRGGKRGSMEET